MKTFRTLNDTETFELGERLGKNLTGSETLAFYGEPGAGKTVMTKGIAKGLGIDELVTSPTFTILNVYEGRAKLFHYDMYRITDASELEEIGFWENIGEGVNVIEWSENIEREIPKDAIKIKIEYSEKERIITVYEDSLL